MESYRPITEGPGRHVAREVRTFFADVEKKFRSHHTLGKLV